MSTPARTAASTLAEAFDPAASPVRLQALAVHPDHRVQRAVAANPSASRELVLALLETYPAEAASNPTLLLWLLERPDLLRQHPKVVPALLTVEPPGWLVASLQAHWDERSLDRSDALLGKWLARRRQLPAELFAVLADHPSPAVRRAVQAHPDLPRRLATR